MPSQSSRPHLPRVQSLACLEIVYNILSFRKKKLSVTIQIPLEKAPRAVFSVLNKPPNVWLSGQQKLCPMQEARAKQLPIVILKDRAAKPLRPLTEMQQKDKTTNLHGPFERNLTHTDCNRNFQQLGPLFPWLSFPVHFDFLLWEK